MPAADTALPRVFIACAPQDLKHAEVIIARARRDRLPVIVCGFGEGRVDEPGWQTECRRRIRSSRVMIMLVSPRSRESRRALWQVACARELGIPIVGLTVDFAEETDGAGGEAVRAEPIRGWRWKTLAATIMQLAAGPVPTSGAAVDVGAAGGEAGSRRRPSRNENAGAVPGLTRTRIHPFYR